MPTFGQKTIKQVIQEVESNLASLEKLELIKSASFCMKSAENTVALSAALAKNTVINTVVLRQCEISDAGVEAIAAALEHNETIEELDLQDNNITTSGVIALAKGLQRNRGVRTLNLLGQTQKVLGDNAVEALIAMFEHNTTLVKIIWKVNSRRSWEVSKLITRNVSIQKAKTSGTDASHLMPTKRPEEASPEPAPALPPTPPLAVCTTVPELAEKPAAAPAPKPEDADDSSTRAASAAVPSDASVAEPSDVSAATSGANSPAPKGGEAATLPAAAEEQDAPEPPAPAAPEPEADEADEATPASPAAAAPEPEAGEPPEEAAPASPAPAEPPEEAAAADGDAPQEDK